VTARDVIALALAATVLLPATARAQRAAGPPGPPPTPRASAAVDLTGYWVSVVSEDWRYRMVTPAKGDYNGLPINRAAADVADRWDPAADERAGSQCKGYGAAALLRLPGRLHISWDGEAALMLEADAGTQTRRFRFGTTTRPGGRSWQGESAASWDAPRGARGRGAAAAPSTNGSLKVVTTNLKAGYLRKNGVPYSENATVTEYFSVARLAGGGEILVVTTVVDDPVYLTQPYIVSSQFKKQPDAAGWSPTPCSASW
jgi:hypothetical protein